MSLPAGARSLIHGCSLISVLHAAGGLWLRSDRNPDKEELWKLRDGAWRRTCIVRFKL